MEKIYKLLENNKLQGFYNQFVELGIVTVQDFIDGVKIDEDLDNMSKICKQIFSEKVATFSYNNTINTILH